MENLKDDIKGKLELLFHIYDFENLTHAQQIWVNQYLPKVEYQRYRNSILAAKSVFEKPLIEEDIPISSKVKNRLTQQASRSSTILEDMVQMQVKVWQVAAGFLLLLGTGLLTWLQAPYLPTVAMSPQIIYKTDTVYKAVPILLGSNEPRIKKSSSVILSEQKEISTHRNASASLSSSTILNDTVSYAKQELSHLPETLNAQVRNWTLPYIPIVQYVSDTLQLLEGTTRFMMKESLGTAIKDDKSYLELIKKVY